MMTFRLLLAAFAAVALPAADRSRELVLEANRLLDAGQYAQAESLYRSVEADNGAAYAQQAKGNLCVLLARTGRYGLADRCYTELTASVSQHGASLRFRGIVLNNHATLLRKVGNLAEAEASILRALDCGNEASVDAGSLQRWRQTLASIYLEQGRLEDASAIYRQTVDAQRPGIDGEQLGHALHGLGEVELRQGKYTEAARHFEEAQVLFRARYGPGHPYVGIVVNNLAQAARLSGRRADAEPLYRRALEIIEAGLGNEHPDLALVLGNFGDYLAECGRDAAALKIYARALAVHARAFGEAHEYGGDLRLRMAHVLRRMGRDAASAALLRQGSNPTLSSSALKR